MTEKNQNTTSGKAIVLFVALLCSLIAGCSSAGKIPISPDEAFLKKYPTHRKNGKAYKIIPNEDILMRENVPPPPAPNNDPVSVRVSLPVLRAWLYKNGVLAATAPICPGKEGYETPSGNFRVVSKHRDWVSTLYHVPMPYFLRLDADGGKVGLHSGAMALSPASHGCIRLPEKMAALFFSEVPVGTRVVVTSSPPQVLPPAASSNPRTSTPAAQENTYDTSVLLDEGAPRGEILRSL